MTDGLSVRFTPMQSRVLRDRTRFKVAICGRRGGKTFLGNGWLAEGALTVPGSVNWYIGPTLDDARQLFYEPMLDLLPPEYIGRSNRTQLEITTVYGSILKGLSSDKSKRGMGVDRVVLDEAAWWDNFDAVWQGELRPALSDKLGSALFTTTPAGYNHAYDLFMKGGDDRKGYQWTTVEGGQVEASEVEAARADMDPRIFAQEYLASFETLEGRVYSNFDRALNVQPTTDTGGELYIGMDFNVNPMSAVIGVKAGDELHMIDEVELLTSNTEEMAEVLRDKYPGRYLVVCPDPSGKARKTSAPAGQTDFSILRRAGFELR